MSTTVLSVSELLEIYINEIKSTTEDLTDFNEGSMNDVEGGATATAVNEVMGLIIDQFKKTFFDSAEGPEATGGPDDLQTLATDHFGDAFKRPGAQKAVGIVTFSRPNALAGNVNILAGTIVKTQIDSSGKTQRFATLLDVVLLGTSVNASVQAVVGGSDGNVSASTISVIETSLTDPTVTVTNADDTAGGAPTMNDPDYRQFIRNLIESIKGATKAAIEAKAKTVSGVITATLVEIEKTVIEWDIANSLPIGTWFRIPYATLYVADANGTANAALIANVKAAIEFVRAAGVRVLVLGATPFSLNWTAQITLDSMGPNFAELSTDPQRLLDTMEDYIDALGIGTGFDVSDANAALLAIWGPAGTGDLVTDGFITVAPSGDVAGSPGIKIIPGVMAIGSC